MLSKVLKIKERVGYLLHNWKHVCALIFCAPGSFDKDSTIDINSDGDMMQMIIQREKKTVWNNTYMASTEGMSAHKD